jgi:hypothetical protein
MSKLTPVWKKFDKNPVLGGEFGTCFDLCVLKVQTDIWLDHDRRSLLVRNY